MRVKVAGALLVACAASAAAAAPAGALVANTPSGPVGYLPLNETAAAHVGAAQAASGPHAASESKGTLLGSEPQLEYHGGPVMHSHAAYVIFWKPAGYSFPAGYAEGIETYLENVAADSGKPTNVYSVSAQYTDETGHAAYSDTYEGSVTDTNPFPTSGTCPTYKGSETFTACITDRKLEDQVELVVAAEGWPKDLATEYYVVLPPKAGSCFDTTGKDCFDKQFCAYHSYSEPEEEIYANISYSAGDPAGCGVPELPNGLVDHTLSSLSHEANESITDPLLTAWFDEEEEEDGDKCRNVADEYGPPLGGEPGSLFNEEIGSGHYYLQQEWSNDVEGCAQRVEPAQPQIADPEEVAPGELVQFDATGSIPGSGGIVSYAWEFGDGGTATGPTPTHSYSTVGTKTVSLTVEDDGEFTYSTTREVQVVASPQRRLTVTLAGTGSGTISGSGISCPGVCTTRYANGQSVTLTATPAAGSTFSGWSGACGGTGVCELTMSSKKSVTATFTALPSPASTSTSPVSTVAPASAPRRHKPRCRKGFRKVKRHGKVRCVKVRRHHRRHR